MLFAFFRFRYLEILDLSQKLGRSIHAKKSISTEQTSMCFDPSIEDGRVVNFFGKDWVI